MKPRQGIPSQCGHAHPVSHGRCLLDFDHTGDHETTAGTWPNVPTALPLVASAAPQEDQAPIQLNAEQERVVKDWAADDRLWTTQDTVAFNLRTFARKMLASSAAPPVLAAPPQEQIAGHLEYLRDALRESLELPKDAPDEDIIDYAAEHAEFLTHYERCLTSIAEAAGVRLNGSEMQWSEMTTEVVAKLKAALAAPPQEESTLLDKSFAELMAYKEPVDNSMPLAAPPPREDALALDGLQRIIDEMHALWDDAPSADDTIRLERLDDFADELDTELARLRLAAPSSQPQKATEGAP